MKPGYRPGKPGTAGKSTRTALAASKPYNPKKKPAAKKRFRKEGMGGNIKEIDFLDAPQKHMKGAEYEGYSHEGIRRLPKRSGTPYTDRKK